MNVRDALLARRSIKWFDPEDVMDDAALQALLEPVLATPTAYNLQHNRFIVVRDKAVQAELAVAAYGQRQVRECAAVVVVAAHLAAHEHAERRWEGAPPEVARRMASNVRLLYTEDVQLQRDEAIRSGSLASMALMLRATEMGLGTCPMIGFDPGRVRAILAIPPDHLCALMLCVGRALKPAHPRVGQLAVSEVVRIGRFDGPGFEPPASRARPDQSKMQVAPKQT